MVNIHLPYTDTWTISTQILHQLKNGTHRPRRLTKFKNIFTNVSICLRLLYNPEDERRTVPAGFYFEFLLLGSRKSADICIRIKNTDIKHYMKNVVCLSATTFLSSDIFERAIFDGKCEIEINGMFYIERDEYPTIPRMIDTDEKLWKNKEKDFDIIVIDGQKNEEKIQIHKEILMTQSPAFEGMLNSGMEESKTNTLKIIDFEFKTVKLVVEFIYGHDLSTSTSFEDIFELYRFADKYFIDNLMDYIITFLSYRLTPSNVIEISTLVNASTFVKLQQTCEKFISVCTENEISFADFHQQ